MSWLSLVAMVAYLAGEVSVFLIPAQLGHQLGALEMHHTGGDITPAIPIFYRAMGLAVELIPSGLIVWALIELFRLFQLYARGEVFARQAFIRLNRVAVLMFWYVIVSFVAGAPVSLILTWWRGHGHREISLGFTSYDLEVLFVAGVALVIARVMAEARRVADENESFV